MDESGNVSTSHHCHDSQPGPLGHRQDISSSSACMTLEVDWLAIGKSPLKEQERREISLVA